MSYTVESKNQLAKLLATENIIIEHRAVRTASFDMKARVLTCPIWKIMSGELYDLFMGHEVGHALDTPLEGWHDAVSVKGKNYKHFLNVVEDARIEKRMKRRYPGLKKSFYASYKELIQQDFFGIKNKNINSMSLIDRINLHFKCGSELDVQFKPNEMEYVELVESCESWNDVISVTDKLFGYCKIEQQEKLKNLDFKTSFDDFDMSSDEDSYSSSEGEEESYQEDGSQDASGYGDEFDEELDQEESYFGSSDSNSDFEPTAETDEHFRQMEYKLLDDKCKTYEYLNIPKPKLEHIVTPQKRVHELLNQYLNKKDKNKNLMEFKKKNEAYISLLVKEFEMRKAAKSFAKRKISSTGDIDLNRIYRYKIEDSIFRKIAKVKAGKSHGLVLLLDRSGSMMRNMTGAIEQVMVLAMFCRRINIPFVVYGFGSCHKGRRIDFPNKEVECNVFDSNADTLKLRNVYLREYLNSEMKMSEFNAALSNLCTLKNAYTDYNLYNGVPPSETLSDTPLIQAMVAMRPIVDIFRSSKKLDIVNLVVVHDGDADNIPQPMYSGSTNYVLCDREKKFQIKVDLEKYRKDAVRAAIFEWFSHVTDTKIFGFFIVESGRGTVREALDKRFYVGDTQIRELKNMERVGVIERCSSKLKTEKFIVSDNPSYEKFFFILGGKNLVTEEFELKEETLSVRRLKTEFLKKYEKRKINRVLVNQFIEGIAK